MVHMTNVPLLVGCFFGGLTITLLILLLLLLVVRRGHQIRAKQHVADPCIDSLVARADRWYESSASQHGVQKLHSQSQSQSSQTRRLEQSPRQMEQLPLSHCTEEDGMYRHGTFLSISPLIRNVSYDVANDPTLSKEHPPLIMRGDNQVLQMSNHKHMSCVEGTYGDDSATLLRKNELRSTAYLLNSCRSGTAGHSDVSIDTSQHLQLSLSSACGQKTRPPSWDSDVRRAFPNSTKDLHSEQSHKIEHEQISREAAEQKASSLFLGECTVRSPESCSLSVAYPPASPTVIVEPATEMFDPSTDQTPERVPSSRAKQSHRIRMLSMSGFLSARSSAIFSSDSHCDLYVEKKSKRPTSLSLSSSGGEILAAATKRSSDFGMGIEKGRKRLMATKRAQSVDLLTRKPFQSVSLSSTFRHDAEDTHGSENEARKDGVQQYGAYSEGTNPRNLSSNSISEPPLRHLWTSSDSRRRTNQSVNSLTGEKRFSLQVVGSPLRESVDSYGRGDERKQHRSSLRFVRVEADRSFSPLY